MIEGKKNRHNGKMKKKVRADDDDEAALAAFNGTLELGGCAGAV